MTTSAPSAIEPEISVVIATYNRTESLVRLLKLLALQTIAPDRFEVVVVDDGSRVPAEPVLTELARSLPYHLHPITQANGGPGSARNTGIQAARGSLVVIVDDDMRVGTTFLEAHLAAHPAGTRRVTLGVLLADPDATLPLFERYQMEMLNRLYTNVRSGTEQMRGWDLYTGNVSFRRADYLAVGGFDRSLRLSEDAELGMRLEEDGVSFTLSDDAASVNASDHVSVRAWMRRSLLYGKSDARISDKHPELPAANPWRFLFMVNRVSRPFLFGCVLVPWLMRPVAWLAMGTSLALSRLGLERIAIAGTTFAYGLQYFRGLRAHCGSMADALASLRRYKAQQPTGRTGTVNGLGNHSVRAL